MFKNNYAVIRDSRESHFWIMLRKCFFAWAIITFTSVFFVPNATARAASPDRSKMASRVHFYLYTVRWVSREGGPAKAFKKFGEAYGFSPSTITANKGQLVTISIRNLEGGPDDMHSFTLPAYHIDRPLPPLQTVSVTFKANRVGVFQFYCDHHKPWMSGQLVVLSDGSR